MKLIITRTLSHYPKLSKGHSRYEWWWKNWNFLFLTKAMVKRLKHGS